MRRRIICTVMVVLAAQAAATAGEIYGRVFQGTDPVAAGAATVEVKCGDVTYPAAATDKTGSYRVVAESSGKCSLTVKQAGQSASLGVASYDEAVQVDLALETKDGKLTVRRK